MSKRTTPVRSRKAGKPLKAASSFTDEYPKAPVNSFRIGQGNLFYSIRVAPPEALMAKGYHVDHKMKEIIIAATGKPGEMDTILALCAASEAWAMELGTPRSAKAWHTRSAGFAYESFYSVLEIIGNRWKAHPEEKVGPEIKIFAARIHGDSMNPRFNQGEIVYFETVTAPASGDLCFVRFADGHTTFKRVDFTTDHRNKAAVKLTPLNTKYRPLTVPSDDITGLYIASYKRINLDRGELPIGATYVGDVS